MYGIYNLCIVILTNTQRPKTYNEKKFEEEQQAKEENQKKIAMEYETSKEDLKKCYKKCISEPGLSQNKQQECYKGESVSQWIILIHIIICFWDRNWIYLAFVSPPCNKSS